MRKLIVEVFKFGQNVYIRRFTGGFKWTALFTLQVFCGGFSGTFIVPAPATQPPGQAIPSSRYPLYLPAFAILNNFIHSSSPCAFAIFTSRSGFILCIAFTTAFATPPLTAKPLPSALEKESGSSSGSSAANLPLWRQTFPPLLQK